MGVELRTLAVVGGCHANGEPTGKIKSKRLYRPRGGKKPEFESPLEHQEKACRKSGRLFQVIGNSE